jgi:alkaline phosphatase
MRSSKFSFLFIFAFLAIALGDEYHDKVGRNGRNIEYKDIDPILKELEGYNEFWNTKAQKLLEDQLKVTPNTKKAKNIILFIADGLSISTTAAARMYTGGEEKQLSYEKFSHFGLARTYCVDYQVASSTCAANALLHGVKNNRRGIGVNANVLSSQCHFDDDDRTYSIAKWAQQVGKATGFVTNTDVTHGTPASTYAHVSERDWYNNADISQECRNDPSNSNVDIAYQLIHNDEAKPFKVILGGGRRQFLNTTMQDEEEVFGQRTDGKNLINEWLNERNKLGKAEYIWNKKQLEELDISKTDYLLGLFESHHLMYRLDILNNNLQNQEPQLAELTRTAIKMLEKEEKGFFLMVEGGRIGEKFINF